MRLLRAAPALVVLLLFGSVQATEMEPEDRIIRDAARCLDALGIELPLTSDRTTTCVVTYLHVGERSTRAFDPIQPQPDRRIELSAQEALFPLLPGLVTYGDGGEAFIQEILPRSPLRFEDSTPLHGKFHIKAPDLTGPICLRLELALEVVDPGGTTRTATRGHATGSLDASQRTGPLPCPQGSVFPTERDGTAAVDIVLPPVTDGTIGASERVFLNLTAHTEGFQDLPVQPVRFRLVDGPDHPNHLTLPIVQALQTTVAPNWPSAGDGLTFRVTLESPVGENDVRPAHATLRVVDDEGQELDPDAMIAKGARHPAHLSCSGCWGTTQLVWPLGPGILDDRGYRAEITTWNTQRTARVTLEEPFLIRANGTQLLFENLEGAIAVVDLRPQITVCDCVGPDDTRRKGPLHEALAPGPPAAVALLFLAFLLRRRTRL